jgi:uncharacterized protein (DUF433 family)
VQPIQLAPRITATADVCGGRAVVQGTRVPVDVLVGQVAAGLAVDDVAREYHVTRDDVFACLAYAASVVGAESFRAA